MTKWVVLYFGIGLAISIGLRIHDERNGDCGNDINDTMLYAIVPFLYGLVVPVVLIYAFMYGLGYIIKLIAGLFGKHGKTIP